MLTQELVTDVSPLIADIGYRYYFAPETEAVAEELGLDLFSFYFLGRGGVLGDVEAPVVAAAFGSFNPDAISMMWNGARSKLAPREAARRHLGCCAEFGRRYLSGVDGLEAFCATAECRPWRRPTLGCRPRPVCGDGGRADPRGRGAAQPEITPTVGGRAETERGLGATSPSKGRGQEGRRQGEPPRGQLRRCQKVYPARLDPNRHDPNFSGAEAAPVENRPRQGSQSTALALYRSTATRS